MRNARLRPNEMRATFVVDRTLVADFRKLALKRHRTLSSELRKLMADEVAREREEQEWAA